MNTRMNFSQAPFWLLCSALALVGGPVRAARAQESLPLAADQVAFQVNVCVASMDTEGVDAECESIQKQLPVRFSSLKFQQGEHFELELGQPQDFKLPAGPQLYFRPIAIAQSKLQMHVQMPGIVNTLVQLGSGRSVILAGVMRQKGRDVIVELRPRFIAPTLPPSRVAETPRPRRTRAPEVRQVGGHPSPSLRAH